MLIRWAGYLHYLARMRLSLIILVVLSHSLIDKGHYLTGSLVEFFKEF